MNARTELNRRGFLQSAAVVSAGVLAGAENAARAAEAASAGAVAENSGKRFRKAVGYGMVQGDMPMVEKFKLLKELGFDGVEMGSPNTFDAKEVSRARDESGLSIHGVVDSKHWKYPFSSPDATVRARTVEYLKTAIRDAKAYGCSTVLVVPAVVDKQISYTDAYKRSQEEISKTLPLAQETGIKIAIENVWNDFLLGPFEAARYVDEFESPMVGWYFDVGNVIRYGWPEQWIRILGKRILKVHVKEFSKKRMCQPGMGKGFKVELLEGDNDWPAVMKALREVGYADWYTAEIPGGDRDRLKEIATRMDRIFAS
jgi:hexulose-6-phosphate isomerase